MERRHTPDTHRGLLVDGLTHDSTRSVLRSQSASRRMPNTDSPTKEA
jgi:hypothetical protein